MTHDTAGSGAHGATFAEMFWARCEGCTIPMPDGEGRITLTRFCDLLDGAQPTHAEATSLALALGLSGGAFSDWMATAGYAVDGDGA